MRTPPKDMIVGTIHKTNNCDNLHIVEYIDSCNVRVSFLNTGYTAVVEAGNIRKGSVKDLLSPSVYGVGCVGIGKHETKINGRNTKPYDTWNSMLTRCYSQKSMMRSPTYHDVTVCEEWHNFQNFADWFYVNYAKGLHLDKDVKVKGNKIYSPDTCLFITKANNSIQAKASRHTFINPQGESVEVYNLTQFCRDNNLHQQCMSRVHLGERPHHKGWLKA